MDSYWKAAHQWSQEERRAWARICPDGEHCFLCPHDSSSHECQFVRPHVYELATEEEVRDRTIPLHRHDLPGGGFTLVRRVFTSRDIAVIASVCALCEKGVPVEEALCYYTSRDTGEVVGIGDGIGWMKGDMT